MPAPSLSRFEQLYRTAEARGLNEKTAYGYAVLGWWLEHYGITAPTISSGHRDAARQDLLRAAWDTWVRRGRKGPAPYGLVTRPATNSAHTTGDGFDLSAPREILEILGAWAPQLGLRWGGNFSDRDPVHFDSRA